MDIALAQQFKLPYLDAASQTKVNNLLQNRLQELLQAYYPWSQQDSRSGPDQDDPLVRLWRQQWGELDDPRTQEKIRNTIRALLQIPPAAPDQENLVQQAQRSGTMLQKLAQSFRKP